MPEGGQRLGSAARRLIGSRLAAFVPAGTAETASACRWRWSVRLRAKPVVCLARIFHDGVSAKWL